MEPIIETDNEAVTAFLEEPFEQDVIEEKNGLLYVPHEHIRDRLIQATDNQFDWDIKQVIFRETSGEVRRSNDPKTGEDVRPTVMIVIGKLTIPGLGARDGIGVHPLDKGAGEDAAYKSAESDAVKRAAMAFGVGLKQLYIDTGSAKRGSGQAATRSPQSAPVNRAASGQRQQQNAPQEAAGERQQATVSASKPTIQNPSAPASKKQIDWLNDLLTSNNFNPDDFDFDDPPLTKGEASDAIDALKNTGQLPASWAVPNA